MCLAFCRDKAMTMKLSPGRRILLLITLVLLFLPDVHLAYGRNEFDSSDIRFFAGVALLVLLALELADRVTMSAISKSRARFKCG